MVLKMPISVLHIDHIQSFKSASELQLSKNV